MAYVRNKPNPVSKKYRGGYTDWTGKQQSFTGTTSKAETLAMARKFEDEHTLKRYGQETPQSLKDAAKKKLQKFLRTINASEDFAEEAKEYAFARFGM